MISIKVILTDLDGVIRHWNSDTLNKKENEFGLRSGHLFSICFEKELLSQVITGQISDSEWRKNVQKILSNSIGEVLAEELIKTWTNSDVRIDNRIRAIYKDFFPEAKIVLATNATSRLAQDMKNHQLENLFDDVLNSSELGVAKPSHGFFNNAINKLRVKFEEVIYIDDSFENVQSAKQLGIRSHHYKDYEQLVKYLSELKSVLFTD